MTAEARTFMVEDAVVNKDRELFESQGFVVVPRVLSAVELAQLQSACDELITLATKNPRDIFCNYYLPHRVDQGALYDVYQRHRVFRKAAEHDAVINAVRRVYAEEFYLFENSLVYKPKGAENEVPWHQDYMYMTDDPDKVIAWLAVDDITEENGCMYVIPGSHKKGPLPFRAVKGQTHSKRTDPSLIDETLAQPVLVRAGDLLLFHQFLLHSSRRVPGTAKRRAYRFALKTLSNSYTPRATPIVLASTSTGALLRPFAEGRRAWMAKVGRRIINLGKRLERMGS
jgi:phytanoyl-CoA hydroxylase